jgi:hypothetical protein
MPVTRPCSRNWRDDTQSLRSRSGLLRRHVCAEGADGNAGVQSVGGALVNSRVDATRVTVFEDMGSVIR